MEKDRERNAIRSENAIEQDRYISDNGRVPVSCNASFKSSYGLTNGVHIKGAMLGNYF